MTGVIQRVRHASVNAEGKTAGHIATGLLVFLGVWEDDSDADVQILARKVANLRIFCEEDEKMNRSILDVGGEILVISNFTLCADTKKGNRPSFSHAMNPSDASRLYLRFVSSLREIGVHKVETGIFGAKMQVEASCNGPITILLDTKIWR